MTNPDAIRPDSVVDRRQVLAGGVTGLVGLAVPVGFAAESPFPSRPLFIMAPANPGGGTDQIARVMRLVLIEERIAPRSVEVINRGGAAGAIGLAELVSRHHGDPYMIMASGGSVVGATIAQNSPFRATDSAPLARLTVDDLVVAVPKESRFATIQELVEAFRRDPGSITWCGGSAGGLDHITVGLIAEACSVKAADLHYVAYAGGGAASAALLGGQVSAGCTGYSEWRSLHEEGRIRILATASEQRMEGGKIATLREAGIDVVMQNWRGVFAPPGLKSEHLSWWTATIDRMRASARWQAIMKRNGWQDGYLVGEAFVRLIRDDEVRYGQILAKLGLGNRTNSESLAGPYLVPAIIGAAGSLAIGVTIAEQVRARGRAAVPAGAEDDDEGGGPLPVWSRLIGGAGLMLVYVWALEHIGFLISTPVFLMGLGFMMRSKRWIRDLIAALGLTALVWLLFTRLLFVQLP